MCQKCEYIAETLVRYRRLQSDFTDAGVRQAAPELESEFEAMRSALHPATDVVVDRDHPSDAQSLKMVQAFYRIFEPVKRADLLARAERYALEADALRERHDRRP